MKTKSAIILLFLLASITCLAQRQADLKIFVEIPDNAAGAIYEIDSLSEILSNKFIVIANDTTTKTHREIQSFFENYKNDEWEEGNVYPDIIQKKHLTIQYLDCSYNYGWVGNSTDSVFSTSTLTALIFIPAFDNVHKGQVVNTVCFKMMIEIYSEAKINSSTNYKREEKIIELKQIDIDN